MLHSEAVSAHTLELLKELMAIDYFSTLRLVGGTALALQYGHRISIDIDLFGDKNLSEIEISKALREVGDAKLVYKTPSIFVYEIEGVKADFVNYHYKWIDESVNDGIIRMASTRDIAAMKLSAISGRGTKKDFVDLYYLLNDYTIKEMLSFYLEKYPDGNAFIVLRSLAYFADADKGQVNFLKDESWSKIKEFITRKYLDYMDSL